MPAPMILCIDDEELGLEVRKLVLQREGYEVLTASDGAKGLTLFDSNQVDAVVLDYAMPGLDGGRIAAMMRQRKPEVPILMLSAYATLPEDVMNSVNSCATKGDGALVLLDRLKELLQQDRRR